MQVAIIGSRQFSNYPFLVRQLSPLSISSIVSGGAAGADSLAARYAKEQSIPLQVFLPAYQCYGHRAPLVRNQAIMAAAQQVIAFWDGHSRGTAHALSIARQLGLPIQVFWPK